jgi:hypothetical protein
VSFAGAGKRATGVTSRAFAMRRLRFSDVDEGVKRDQVAAWADDLCDDAIVRLFCPTCQTDFW